MTKLGEHVQKDDLDKFVKARTTVSTVRYPQEQSSIRNLELKHLANIRTEDYLAEELRSLKMYKAEYERMMTVLKIVAEEDPLGNKISFSITIEDAKAGETWTDIVRGAVERAVKLARGSIED